MKEKLSVCAVVVTYNRKDYLLRLLNALYGQTYSLAGVFIFDNMSTDGTPEMLLSNKVITNVTTGEIICNEIQMIPTYYYRNNTNSGGSGGFHDAIKMTSEMGYDYLWTMDDDVLPEPDCVEKLLSATDYEAEICVPNRTDEKFTDYAITAFDMKNPLKYSAVARKTKCPTEKIEGDYVCVYDMPFEGPLISVSLVKQIGLPRKELFIIYDDTEYAQRAAKVTKIRFVKSAILHKQIIPNKDPRRLMGWKEYYGYRNQFWFDRTYGENIGVRFVRPILQMLELVAKAILKRKWTNLNVLFAAYHDGTKGILGKTVTPGKSVGKKRSYEER